jgi:hypothetical protein
MILLADNPGNGCLSGIESPDQLTVEHEFGM